ncbi:hypothetical protein [Terribacillus sp. JSM ZJ617]|uniref:hypothetical protein n=1 Tax=Terribacillus sp. JSM ZJ617 TaxID=3342119 RepID=UPI0035A899A4
MKQAERDRYQQLNYFYRTCKKLGEPFPESLKDEYRNLKAKDTAERDFLMRAMEKRPKPVEPWFPPIKRRRRK